ncbi:MAG: hypothetical protein J2P26_01920 [Nocardiopsaceae bacterium]|nr:hypothetical protein [Nocardiopsaceae bacterium]
MAQPTILPMEVATVPIDAVAPMPGNARVGAHDLISTSLTEHGQYKPLIVQRSTGHIIAGNNTYAVAKSHGWDHIAVQYIDVDDAKARRIAIHDNRTNDLAEYDESLLLELLREIGENDDQDLADLGSLGFTGDDIDALVRSTDTLGNPATAFLDTSAPPPGAPAATGAGAGVPPGTGTPGPQIPPPGLAPGIPTGAVATPTGVGDSSTELVPVQWTVTLRERDRIRDTLRTAQLAWGLETASQALVEIITRAEATLLPGTADADGPDEPGEEPDAE